jgi:mitochondrial fission protein ELM1
MNMALLAHHMRASRQKLGIARTMRRVTVQAILADRRMIPEKWATFFGMAGVTRIIDGLIHEHLPPLPAVRIVAGSAADLHVAMLGTKQVCGALKKVRTPIVVAGETSLLVGSEHQHFCLRLGVVGAMTGQVANVTSIVMSSTPAKMGAIPGVALQARFVGCRSRQVGWIDDVGW